MHKYKTKRTDKGEKEACSETKFFSLPKREGGCKSRNDI